LSVPRGAQRATLVLLAFALAAASFGAYEQAGRASDALAAEATSSAEDVAAAIGSKLLPEDLEGPVGGERYETITSYLDGGVLRPNETATVLNQAAVVVFAADRDILGHKQSRAKVTRALSLGTQSELASGTFSVFVPVTVGAGSEMAIVQISGPSGPIEAGQRTWTIVAYAAAGFALMVLVFAFVRGGGRSAGFGDAISPSRVLDIERRPQPRLASSRNASPSSRLDRISPPISSLPREREVPSQLSSRLPRPSSRRYGLSSRPRGPSSRPRAPRPKRRRPTSRRRELRSRDPSR